MDRTTILNANCINKFFDIECKNNLNFLYANIRSLRQNFNSFLLYLDKINSKISCIVLTEIWIGSEEVDLYNIQGYTSFHCCNDTYRAGGVLCYVAQDIQASSNTNIKLESADALLINIKCNNLFLNILCLYRFHSYSENYFIEELAGNLENISHSTIIMGDINLNILSNSSNVNKYLSMLNGFGFQQFIYTPTRANEKSQSCLDHIFIRHRNLSIFSSDVFDVHLTDHCMLGLTIKVSNLNCSTSVHVLNPKTEETKYMIDYKKLKEMLRSMDWNFCFLHNDVNCAFEIFHNTVCDFLTKCKKVRNFSKKFEKAKSRSPWINAKLLNKLDKKIRLYKIFKLRPYDRNFVNYYNRFCLNLKNEIEFTKREYFSRKLIEANGDTASQWKIINTLTGMQNKRTVDKIELDNGDIITDPMQVANAVNEYFVHSQSNRVVSDSQLNLAHNVRSFFITPTSANEVIEVIKSLKNKKSSGFDQINVSLIKSISEEISPILAQLFNLSFQCGIFPEILKSSIITPIYKKSTSCKLQDLRPISLLSIFSKIIEKLMKSRLISFLNSINFLSEKQYGFRKGKSTEDALIRVTDIIYTSFNSNKKATGLFIDFQKAFDLVDHNILLLKLEALGVRGVALSWFQSFLIGRVQQVRVGQCVSTPLPVTAGVPQGSVISATLFLVFINDLLECRTYGVASAFADDIAYFYAHENKEELRNQILEDLLTVRKWCVSNKMSINVNKTRYVNFSFTDFKFNSEIKFHNLDCNNLHCSCEVIAEQDNFKYLGLNFNSRLNWETHILDLQNKLKSAIRKFYFLRNFCSEDLLKSLYYALVESRLQYGIVCWGGTFKYLVKKLRVVQNHFIRIILSKSIRNSSFPLFVQLKLLPLQHLFVYKVLRVFYSRSGNMGTTNLSYDTRSIERRMFRVPKVNKSVFKQSFSYLSRSLFNKLPQSIKQLHNFKIFCSTLKEYLLSKEDIYHTFFN
jgi:hypothetical protein